MAPVVLEGPKVLVVVLENPCGAATEDTVGAGVDVVFEKRGPKVLEDPIDPAVEAVTGAVG